MDLIIDWQLLINKPFLLQKKRKVCTLPCLSPQEGFGFATWNFPLVPKSKKFSCIKNIQNMKIINSKAFKSTKSCITEKSHVLLQNFSWINIVWKERWNITMARTNYTHFEKTHLKLPLQIFIFFQKNCIFLKQKKGLVQTCFMYYRT